MEGVSGARNDGHHFTLDEEEALRRPLDAGNVMARAREQAHVAGGDEHIRGDDKSLREVREEHRGFGDHAPSHIAHGYLEAAHFMGAPILEAGALGAGAVIIGAVGGLVLGEMEIAEAHAKGIEQKTAIEKDQMHVALIGTLDLPEAYRAHRFAAYPDVDRGDNSIANKAMMVLQRDPKAIGQLRLQADRGMHAALDFEASGMSLDAFLKANPKIAAAYAKDAAFHEGFGAIRWASHTSEAETKKLTPKEIEVVVEAKAKVLAEMKSGLERRDGWYSQAAVNIRL